MATWSRMQQVCATCRFWQGQRKIDAWGEFYEAIDDLGQCCNWEGGFNQTTTSEGGYCSDWESYKKTRGIDDDKSRNREMESKN